VVVQGVPLQLNISDGGQVTTGGSSSTIVIVDVHLRVFPAASVAWNTTLFMPTGKKLPLFNPDFLITSGLAVQLSVAVAVTYCIVTPHESGLA
jgi:hypothetical protein